MEFDGGGLDLPRVTEDLERRAIEEALRRTDGVITEAARTLHITRRMLRYKMDKLHIASSRAGDADEEPEELDKNTPAAM